MDDLIRRDQVMDCINELWRRGEFTPENVALSINALCDVDAVILPCKPWDKVWILDKWAEAVCEGEIVRLTYNGFTTPQEWIEFKWDSPFLGEQARYTRIDLCVGKMLFFDREEAEAALAMMKG